MNKKSITLKSLLMFIFSTMVQAESNIDLKKNDLLQCQLEMKSVDRLACYDNARASAKKGSKALVDVGKWQALTQLSPIDDSENAQLSLDANEPINSQSGRAVIPKMFIFCSDKKTELYVDWGTFLGSNTTQMLYRLDKQKAKEQTWNISTDSKVAFYQGDVLEFVKSLSKANGMYTQITPYYTDRSVNTTFDLKGLSEALKPLQKACGWQ